MKLRIEPDKERAKALIESANLTLQKLNEINISKYPEDALKDYYDSIHRLIEALNYLEGIKIKGEGAHLELIEYFSKIHNLEESNRQFLQELKDYRNKINYEGFKINLEYLETNLDRIKALISKIKKLIKTNYKIPII